jgi:hypothetical protein
MGGWTFVRYAEVARCSDTDAVIPLDVVVHLSNPNRPTRCRVLESDPPYVVGWDSVESCDHRRINRARTPVTYRGYRDMTTTQAHHIITGHCGDVRRTQLAWAMAAYGSSTGRPTAKAVAAWITTPTDILERLCAERNIA